MTYLAEDLGRSRSDERLPPVALNWSAAKINDLDRLARGDIQPAVAVDAVLAPMLLMCAKGEFEAAERNMILLLRDYADVRQCDEQTFISLLNGAFTLQRLDLVAAMLRDRHGFNGEFELARAEEGIGSGQVRWEIFTSGKHRFIFDNACWRYDNTRLEILAFQWEFPLLANYSQSKEQETGSVILGREDIGRFPGLTYCDSRPEFFLIPDCIFVPSRGYSYARSYYRDNDVAWPQRRPMALWRGATTGVPASPGDWTSLPRIKLCQIARAHENSGLIDAGISAVVQFGDPTIEKAIRGEDLIRGFMPWQSWNSYKYQIDIDGNSSPWSNLFQRLLTGSVVLKVESASGFRQWFYDQLIPWRNYVPVASNMWDLMDKIRWLQRHDSVAERIGREGLALANKLSYERELHRSVAVVSDAFRYFSGHDAPATPVGSHWNYGDSPVAAP